MDNWKTTVTGNTIHVQMLDEVTSEVKEEMTTVINDPELMKHVENLIEFPLEEYAFFKNEGDTLFSVVDKFVKQRRLILAGSRKQKN